MKTLIKNSTLGLAIGGVAVIIVAGIGMSNPGTEVQAGGILFVVAAGIRLLLV